MTQELNVKNLDIPLERDLFLRKLLRELTGTLQDIVGMEAATGYINTVGAVMGEWIEQQYRQGLGGDHLDVQQVADVFVDLKQRLNGDFYIISLDNEKIVVGNRRCPFGEFAQDRPSLCMMTSNVFGRIAAENIGYARVELQKTIAQKDPECRIVVHLKPRENAPADEREYYSIPDSSGTSP